MPNEFIVKNGLISQGNITISGSITATGGVTVSGSIASASYASNAELLDGLDSTVFTLTSSFNAQTASFTAFTSSMNSFSASILTNVTALNAKTASFATTGSNTFVGAEIISGSLAISGSGTPFTLNTDTLEITGSLIVTGSTTLTGSLLQLGNFTTTGTIIAQTINVQTVTSSIVYSSGSNVFGNSLGNSQVFTGSVLITGSLTIAGASSATSYSGTTIYGSTAVCSAVGKFSTCLDLGGALTGTSATFSSCVTATKGTFVGTGYVLDLNRTDNTALVQLQYNGTIGSLLGTTGANNFIVYNASASPMLTLSGGAATFSSTITGTTIYGSTAVCSAVGYFSGCVGIGTITPNTYLQIVGNISTTTGLQDAQFLTITNSNATANNYSAIMFKDSDGNNSAGFGVQQISHITNEADIVLSPRLANGDITERIRIKGNGNVGIGTASPCAKLHINGSTGASTYKGFAYTYAGSETLINEVLFQAVVGGYSSNLPIFLFKDERSDQGTTQRIFEIQGGRSGVGTILTTLASGNVGIGTSSPVALTEIKSGDITNGGTAKFTLALRSGTTTYFDIYQGYNSTIAGQSMFGTTLQSSDALGFATSNIERMRITSGGNVGIGVTPSAGWTNGIGLEIGFVGSAIWGRYANEAHFTNNFYYSTSAGCRVYASTNPASDYEQYDGNHTWYTAPSGTAGQGVSLTSRMTILQAGNVGIGTNSPQAKLHVSCTANFGAILKVSDILTESTGILALGDGGTSTINVGVWRAAANSMSSYGNWLNLGGYDGILFSVCATGIGSQAERMRIRNDGGVLIGKCTTSVAGSGLQLLPNGETYFTIVNNINTLHVYDTTNSAYRFYVGGNGGISNYQANNINLSDERTKKDIITLESYWDKFKAIKIVKFKYKDQTHDDFNIGVIAQQVESIAPEFVDVDGFGETPEDGIPYKTIYTSDLHHATIAVLQEAMTKIETLEAKVTALENK